ncbi:MAG: hypothetical protein QG551_143 [Patescibacteria group bacterium]|jgi:hypothetical protein|nr:hypothetical protein [Patescibacteria group bacterium]
MIRLTQKGRNKNEKERAIIDIVFGAMFKNYML